MPKMGTANAGHEMPLTCSTRLEGAPWDAGVNPQLGLQMRRKPEQGRGWVRRGDAERGQRVEGSHSATHDALRPEPEQEVPASQHLPLQRAAARGEHGIASACVQTVRTQHVRPAMAQEKERCNRGVMNVRNNGMHDQAVRRLWLALLKGAVDMAQHARAASWHGGPFWLGQLRGTADQLPGDRSCMHEQLRSGRPCACSSMPHVAVLCATMLGRRRDGDQTATRRTCAARPVAAGLAVVVVTAVRGREEVPGPAGGAAAVAARAALAAAQRLSLRACRVRE